MNITVTPEAPLLYTGGMAASWIIPSPVWAARIACAFLGGMLGARSLTVGVAPGDLIWPRCAIFGPASVLSLYGDLLSRVRKGARC